MGSVAACARASNWTTQWFNVEELLEVHKVDLLRLSDDVLSKLKSHSKQVVSDIAASDPMAKKVIDVLMRYTANTSFVFCPGKGLYSVASEADWP